MSMVQEITACLIELGKKAPHLIKKNAHEIAIAGELKSILEKRGTFKGLQIDIEYNRKGNAPKALDGINIRPDLIVHTPDEHGNIRANNILALEIKKFHHPEEDKQHARGNLKKMKSILNYQAAIYVEINTNAGPQATSWFQVEEI